MYFVIGVFLVCYYRTCISYTDVSWDLTMMAGRSVNAIYIPFLLHYVIIRPAMLKG